MKKFFIFLLPVFIFMFSSTVKAESLTAEQKQVLVEKLTEKGFTMSNFSINNSKLNTVLDMYASGGKLFIWENSNGYQYCYAGDMTVSDTGYVITSSNAVKQCNKYKTVSSWEGGGWQSPVNNSNVPNPRATFSSQSVRDLNPVDPVYTYSPVIPAPAITARFEEYVADYPVTIPIVPLAIAFSNSDSQYFVELQVRYYTPHNCTVYFGNPNTASYIYVPKTYDSSGVIDIYTYKDEIDSFSSLTPSTFKSSWNDYIITNLPRNDWFTYEPNDIDVTFKDRAYRNYENCLYAMFSCNNKMEVWIRYVQPFLDDSDPVVFYGDWVHWYNTGNQMDTIEVVKQSDVGKPVNGIWSIVDELTKNTQIQQGLNTLNPVGDGQTGSGSFGDVSINNNYAPNYPDYPTAVSYNHDNILLQFIDTSKQLPNFFSQYQNFLTESFTFIPAPIWTIIGVGFLASIVIMIIKIL